ncbi:hypothetical protein L596_004173 [Steinernema carpocapsae]|uniref:Uncharacterized protein n=1 Tax=Steinernema carpocapsae TaxID=34508 RepID=A0A4U8UW04_STECR|nr:hypothetical protein L596_004173 [Steinernema carpocapsae]
MSLKLGVDHRSVTRLFSNSSQATRKSSVPSAVIASAPLISATVGDGLGAQLSTLQAPKLISGESRLTRHDTFGD